MHSVRNTVYNRPTGIGTADAKEQKRRNGMDTNGREYDSLITISPVQLFKVILGRKVLIIVLALLFALVGIIRSKPKTNSFKAEASVIYNEEETSPEYLPAGVSPLSEQNKRVKAYAKLYLEHNVIDQVVDELSADGYETDYDELTNKLKIEPGDDVPVLKITMTGDDEQFLLKTLEHLLDHREDFMFGVHTAGETNIMVVPNATPEKINFKLIIRNVILYGILGAALAIAAIVCAEILRIVTAKAVQSEKELVVVMNSPVLAVVPDVGGKGKKASKNSQNSGPVLISADSKTQYIEAFMMLRTNLINNIERLGSSSPIEREGKVVMITSAIPKEGKSNTGANLASVLSASGYKVLLVDASFRNRTLSNTFGAGSGHKGLLEVLLAEAQSSEAIIPLKDRKFDFMPACAAAPSPVEMLDDRKLKEVFDDLRTKYEMILVDADSVNISSDPSEIGKLCDGCITVFAHATTSRNNVIACRDQLSSSSIPVIGAVLNLYDPMKDSSATIKKYYS